LDGVSYYSYRYFIAGGIAVNSIVTLVFEKLIILKLTQRCDNKNIVQKENEFRNTM
jgi:hypothetical protein